MNWIMIAAAVAVTVVNLAALGLLFYLCNKSLSCAERLSVSMSKTITELLSLKAEALTGNSSLSSRLLAYHAAAPAPLVRPEVNTDGIEFPGERGEVKIGNPGGLFGIKSEMI